MHSTATSPTRREFQEAGARAAKMRLRLGPQGGAEGAWRPSPDRTMQTSRARDARKRGA